MCSVYRKLIFILMQAVTYMHYITRQTNRVSINAAHFVKVKYVTSYCKSLISVPQIGSLVALE